MDPGEGYAELDAAVQQIVYVSNITNNNTTNNTTNIDDRDTFEDNDTVVDSSVNQTILANGDVNQDFDTTIAGEGGIAVAGDVDDANLVTGDNDGVIADDITDSNVVAGDNFGVSGDVEGSAVVGDGNTTQTATGDGSAIGDGNVTGDGNIVGDGNAAGDGAFVGDGNAVGDGAFVGDGNATAEGAISGDGNAVGDGSTVGDGNTQININDNDGVLNIGDGDVNAIEDSTVGAAGFGSGAVSNTEVTDSYNDNSDNSDNSIDNTDNSDNSIDNTDNSDNSIDNSVDHSIDLDLDLVVVDDSNVTGSDIGVQEVEIAEPIAEPADLMPEGA